LETGRIAIASGGVKLKVGGNGIISDSITMSYVSVRMIAVA